MSLPDLFICVFPNSSVDIPQSICPKPKTGDVTIFIKKGETDESPSTYAYHVQGSGGTYTNKKNSKTKFEAGKAFDDAALPLAENAARDPVVYTYLYLSDVGPTMLAMTKALRDAHTGVDTLTANLSAFESVFLDKGQFRGQLMDEDGSITELEEYDYDKSGEDKTPSVNFEAKTKPEILHLVKSVLPAIVYDGFNPSVIRTTWINKGETADIVTRNLLMAFSAYAFIGNKIGKLIVRRVDVDIGQKLMTMVESLGVKKQDRTKNGITLPRLAIAFMPEYLAFRRFMGAELQSQTESTISVEYKDIVFHGCDKIRSMSGYPEFHKAFSALIFETEKDVDPTNEAFLRNYKRWTKVTIAGYRADKAIHKRMDTIIGNQSMSKTAVYSFIKEGIVNDYAVLE